jgi:hypothetical protein
MERVGWLENNCSQTLRLYTETAGLRLVVRDTPAAEARVIDDPNIFIKRGDRFTLFVTSEFMASKGTFRILRPTLKEGPSLAMGFRQVGNDLGCGKMGDIRFCFQNPKGWAKGMSPWVDDTMMEAGTWGVFHLDSYTLRIEDPETGEAARGLGLETVVADATSRTAAGDGKASGMDGGTPGNREGGQGLGEGASNLLASGAREPVADVLERQCAMVKRTVTEWRKAKPDEPIRLVLGAFGCQYQRFGNGQWIFLDSAGEHFINPLTGLGAVDARGNASVPCLTANFNSLRDLRTVAKALKGALDLVCLDLQVFKWTSWGKDHLDEFRQMIRPGGCLQVSIREWRNDLHQSWSIPEPLKAWGDGKDPKDPDFLKGILEQSFPSVRRASVRHDHLLKHRLFKEADSDLFICEVPEEL